MSDIRVEKDSLGEYQVPADAWYGIQTARAVDNFPISGRKPDGDFIRAHVRIKLAAARANCQPGWLSTDKRDAIVAACEKILQGEYLDQFVVDRFQAGRRHQPQHEHQRGGRQRGQCGVGRIAGQLSARQPK